jgi:DNA-binding NtrC family response regulator
MPNVLVDLFIHKPAPGRKIRVLIVEDEPNVRQFWAEVLQSSCDICYASTTTEAIDQINKPKSPDIMVLDWLLLNGTATAVLNFWMSKNCGPCCIISGNISSEDEVSFYRRGVMHVLRKPVHPGTFSSIMHSYMQMVELNLNYQYLKNKIEKLEQRQIILIIAIILAVGGGELLRTIIPLFA